MARRSNASGGWELVGGLIGLGVAYAIDRQRQEIVDQLITSPFHESREALGAIVPMLDDQNWAGFHSILSLRATQSTRARQLLDLARAIRELTPHVVQILRKSQRDQVNTVIDLASKLDDEVWDTFCLAMAGFAKRYEEASDLMEVAVASRSAYVTVTSLLAQPKHKATRLVIQHTLTLDKQEWGLFLLMLNLRAEHNRTAAKLQALAEQTRDLQSVIEDIAGLAQFEATIELLKLSESLDELEHDLLRDVLTHMAKHNTRIMPLLNMYRRVPEALSLVEQLLEQDQVIAVRRLAAEYATHSEEAFPWSTVRLILLLRSRQNQWAGTLLIRSQRYLQIRPMFTRLLASDPEAIQQELMATSIGADAEDALTELATALADTNSAAKSILEALQAIREQRESLVRNHIRTALEDRVITPDEQAEIDALSDRLNVPQEITAQIVQGLRAEIEHNEAAHAQLRSHVELALADGQVTQSELVAIHALRARLNIRHEIVDQIFAEVRSTQEKGSDLPVPWLVAEEIVQTAAPSDRFRQGLREALDDRVITQQEASVLEQLRQSLQLSADVARKIYLEVQAELHS